MDEPVIEVRDLVTRYGKQMVHDGLNFRVDRGQVVALVGGSGSGKSTLLRQMLALERPQNGTIRVLGQRIGDLDSANAFILRRRIGVLFQGGALFHSLTVLENVALPLRENTNLSERLIREIARLKVALTGLPADAGVKFPNELSGGMLKRAALARAIALDPELLFLDEPTAGLDPLSAERFDDLLVFLQRHLGLTIVMVTHDVASICHSADHVVVLGEGRLLGEGTVQELARSDHPMVAAYFRGRGVLGRD